MNELKKKTYLFFTYRKNAIYNIKKKKEKKVYPRKGRVFITECILDDLLHTKEFYLIKNINIILFYFFVKTRIYHFLINKINTPDKIYYS